LSKEAVSIPCTKEATAKDLAEKFYTHVYRHHNIPELIVSDRGPQFISALWNAFCEHIGSKVKLPTACHPETDGHTEIMNQYIDQRLRPYVSHYHIGLPGWVMTKTRNITLPLTLSIHLICFVHSTWPTQRYQDPLRAFQIGSRRMMKGSIITISTWMIIRPWTQA
jgi:hypothetical protein